ncbi:thiamine pyrophosphate-binding protein [Streptomyces montanisoli]|uniref:Thiamine pyrophosphate-requiring protein n=1 Tax=Streptomyces montanisoli TaxID=2798581 RepID=A0A940M8R0_9ACTN|nr:thiamine pyrophosphate-binding protein [Streptomyces montanisoli]MBP0456844.1 thiamine pyrophosphate-requiring protein [Streptomyces montanisoli]
MPHVADHVRDRLRAWDTSFVHGASSGGAEPLLRALAEGEGPRFVTARHGAAAALMASGHARLTGGAGCCVAGSAADAVELAGGLLDARAERVPVVALLCADAGPGGLDAADLLAPVAVHQEVLGKPADAADVVDRAFRAALELRGVALVVLPPALLTADADEPAEPEAVPGRAGWTPPLRVPDERALRRAVDVLVAGKRVLVVVGGAAGEAREAIADVTPALGAGVVKTLAARDVFPDDLVHVTGPADGFTGGAAAALLRDCDTVLLVGDAPPAGRALPLPEDVRLVQVVPPGGTAAAGAEPLPGDPAPTLTALLPLLKGAPGSPDLRWRERVNKDVTQWRGQATALARRHFGRSVNPRAVVNELSARLPERAVVTADRGSCTTWSAHHVVLRDGMRGLSSTMWEAPGAAVPFALAARLADPDRPVIALAGDAGFQTHGIAEVAAVLREADRTSGTAPLVFCVFTNSGIGQADPIGTTPAFRTVPDLPCAAQARLAGLDGILCTEPKQVPAAWDEVLGRTEPVVLQFLVDATVETEVPPVRRRLLPW